jgi:WD40 repeat protein
MMLTFNSPDSVFVLDPTADSPPIEFPMSDGILRSRVIPTTGTICVQNFQGQFCIHSLQTGDLITRLDNDPGSSILAVSPDGTRLIESDLETEFSIRSLITDSPVFTDVVHDPLSGAFSPDGRYFAIGTWFGVRVYDAVSYEFIRELSPERSITYVSFYSISPEECGLFYTTHNWEQTPSSAVFLVPLNNDSPLRPIDEMPHYEFAVVSPNGKYVVTSFVDDHNGETVVTVMDILNESRRFIDGRQITQASFSPDGSVLAVIEQTTTNDIVLISFPKLKDVRRVSLKRRIRLEESPEFYEGVVVLL